jgi:hypothetical protein
MLPMQLGRGKDGSQSWAERMLSLRNRIRPNWLKYKAAAGYLYVRPAAGQLYLQHTVSLKDTPGLDPMTVNIDLVQGGVTVSGKVTNKATGKPIAGAMVEYYPVVRNPYAEKMPDGSNPRSETIGHLAHDHEGLTLANQHFATPCIRHSDFTVLPVASSMALMIFGILDDSISHDFEIDDWYEKRMLSFKKSKSPISINPCSAPWLAATSRRAM